MCKIVLHGHFFFSILLTTLEIVVPHLRNQSKQVKRDRRVPIYPSAHLITASQKSYPYFKNNTLDSYRIVMRTII